MANNGPIRQLLLEPLIADIVVSPSHNYWVKSGEPTMRHEAVCVNEAELVAGRGIRGDRYFEKRANHKGQVTLMTMEAIDEIRCQFDLPGLAVNVFRRNLIVKQVILAELVGREFHIQGVSLVDLKTPC